MKKIIKLLVCSSILLVLFGCGNSDTPPKEKIFVKDDELSDVYSNPDKFINKYIKLSGKIFNIETDEDDVYFQMWQNPSENDNNTFVRTSKEIFKDLKENDYIKLEGYIAGKIEGENMMGGTVSGPKIIADHLKKSSYKDVVSPTIKTIKVNQTKKSNANGVTVTLEKIELSDIETRVYLSIKNESPYLYNFYSFNSKILQNSKQFKEESNYDADYKEIESDIPKGVIEEGVIVFGKIKPSSLQFTCEGHSDNYELDSDEFAFDIDL